MADPLTELEVATQKHFMPVVINQIYLESPILARIFRSAREGQWGLALPSFDGKAIVEPLEIGEVQKSTANTYSTGTVTTTNGSKTVTHSGTGFLATMAGGKITLLDGKIYVIASVTSTSVLLLKTVYEGTGGAGEAFSISYYTYVTDSAGAYGKDTVWGAGSGDVLAGAEFSWKMYQSSLKIHNFDVEINKGQARIFDIAAVKLRSAVRRLRTILLTDYYATQADGADAMIGIRAIVAETGLVGGIQKRAYDWWMGNIDTAGSNRDLTWDLLNTMWYKTKKYGNQDRATLIVTTEGVIQSYEQALTKVVVTGTASTRYQNIYLQAQADKMRKTFDFGFEGFAFKGLDMIADPLGCPANKLFFINENYDHIRLLKQFESTGWQQLRSQGKDWAQMTIFGYLAHTVSCCRKFGMIEALNEA